MAMIKLMSVAILAVLCIVIGVVVRCSAVRMASPPFANSTQIDFGTNVNPVKLALSTDISWFLMGLGALVLTACIHRWLGADPVERPSTRV